MASSCRLVARVRALGGVQRTDDSWGVVLQRAALCRGVVGQRSAAGVALDRDAALGAVTEARAGRSDGHPVRVALHRETPADRVPDAAGADPDRDWLSVVRVIEIAAHVGTADGV